MIISKKTIVSTLTGVLAVGGIQLMQPAQAAELVTNGDFEAGNTGWTTGGSSSSNIGAFGFYHSATRAWFTAAINPNRGTLSQTITGLAAGQTATISFWVGNFNANTPSGLDVSIGALSLFNLSNEPPASFPTGTFVQYTKSFTSPSANPTLFFSGFNNIGLMYVDDVSITTQNTPSAATPEPASIVGLLAFGGSLLASKRRKN
jgi:hypothetical protein